MAQALELGLDTFGDVMNTAHGAAETHAQTIRNVVDEGVLADSVGLDFFGVGEHHRADFAVSAPEVVLAAIAARTERIRLGSAVTVLSSDEPVRVFQRFSTLDAISNGRAEVIVGRGSFTESFPLFGYPMDQYEQLFEEKLSLFAELAKGGPVTWQGSVRAALKNMEVFPTLEKAPLRTWVGVGGSPESVVRAASYDLPMMLAVIGGDPKRFRPYVDLYHKVFAQTGAPVQPVGMHSPGYVAVDDDTAKAEFFGPYAAMHDRIGASRGWPPLRREDFEREVDHGALCVGGPETVARKIARSVRELGLARFDLKYSAGPLPHDNLMRCIELYGSRVAPMVREMLG